MGAAGGGLPPHQASGGRRVFAWAGLRFDLPPGWETGQLGKDHGWLEADFQPVLEFKTAVVRGRFSFRRQLKLLTRSTSLRLQTYDPPAAWRPLLTSFNTRAFRWQGPRLGGEGLIIYCPDCRRATLLQFYQTGRTETQSRLTVLGSFKDHGNPPPTARRWPFTISRRPCRNSCPLRGSVSRAGGSSWCSAIAIDS